MTQPPAYSWDKDVSILNFRKLQYITQSMHIYLDMPFCGHNVLLFFANSYESREIAQGPDSI